MIGLDCNAKLLKKQKKQNPFIITANQYKQMVVASTLNEKRAEFEAADQAYLQSQKNAGEALAAKYTGKRAQTLAEKLKKKRDELNKKSEEAEKHMQKFKENDEKVRQEKIKKAEKILNTLKPGPRLLHCAAMHSEVLRERNVQKVIKDEFDKVIKEEQERVSKACVSLNNPWIKENETQKAEQIAKIKNYKQEIFQTIEENAKEKSLQKKRLLEEQRAERELIDAEIKRQIEKEKLAMEKKRSILRQNAVEAMKMVEQRRQRERMVEEVEGRLNSVYNESKQELDKQLKENMEKKIENRSKIIEENAKLLPNDELKVQQKQEADLARDLNTMELKFTEAELERKRKEKAAKQARIEAHLQEVERQKKLQQYCCQQQLFDMGQRFKNDEVNLNFTLQKAKERRRQLEQFRSMLKEQLDEKERKAKSEVECRLDDPYIQDDQKFFALARQYIADAKEKDRPLYPFIKAIEQYKRDNQIDCVRTLPKHLLSKIAIGCRQTQQNQNAESHKPQDKQNILEECIKTTEMLYSGLYEERTRNHGGGIQGLRPQRSEVSLRPTALECEKCNSSSKASVDENILKSEAKSETDIKAGGDGNKIRYSVSHLKYINQNNNANNNGSRIWY